MTEPGTSACDGSGPKTRYHLLTTDGGIVADQPGKMAGEAAIGVVLKAPLEEISEPIGPAKLLADREQQPIAHMTPHTLRRTFASLLAEIGVSPRRAMYLLGHTDPKFTMRVYQQVLDLGGTASDQLELVLGCTADEAFWLLSRREPRTPVREDARPARLRR